MPLDLVCDDRESAGSTGSASSPFPNRPSTPNLFSDIGDGSQPGSQTNCSLQTTNVSSSGHLTYLGNGSSSLDVSQRNETNKCASDSNSTPYQSHHSRHDNDRPVYPSSYLKEPENGSAVASLTSPGFGTIPVAMNGSSLSSSSTSSIGSTSPTAPNASSC
ncbi:Homeobox protein meis3-A [Fasciolopsis buskii]|uniref:Homeobox protein meis3-A n=1 Tax=Fasciolopsis buskii TaxID=27845 RepID=A0A8E0RXX1_9TREM|nr:Homeobox protein meis3-A [Fasciolopsis buski]